MGIRGDLEFFMEMGMQNFNSNDTCNCCNANRSTRPFTDHRREEQAAWSSWDADKFFVFCTDGLSDLSGRSVGQTVCVRPFSFSFFVVGLHFRPELFPLHCMVMQFQLLTRIQSSRSHQSATAGQACWAAQRAHYS